MNRKEAYNKTVLMKKKTAYNQTVKKWVSRCEGEEGEECGFCEWVKEQGDDWDCAKYCPLYPEVCDSDITGNSLWSEWYQDKSQEKAQKVLAGVIRVGLPWSEEEDGSDYEDDIRYHGYKTPSSTVPHFKKGDRIRLKQPYCGIGTEEQGVVISTTNQSSIEMKFLSRGGLCYLQAKQILLDDRPEPKFKVGDRVRVIADTSRTGMREAGIVGTIKGVRWGIKNWCYDFSEKPYLGAVEHWLEPAPKWVDVTKECEVKIKFGDNSCYMTLSHNRQWLIEAGLNKSRVLSNPNYKIEAGDAGSTPDTFHYFRILHLQEEK